MSDLIRKQLYITKAQDQKLKEKAREYGVTEAELVRQALDLQLDRVGFAREPDRAWEREQEFIAELRQQGAAAGSRSWKREDLYER
jgi:hypothetical protein